METTKEPSTEQIKDQAADKSTNTLFKGKKKPIETAQQKSPFTTEVTDLYCKCIRNRAYGYPFNLIVGRYYQVQNTVYRQIRTGGYSAEYSTPAGILGGSTLCKMLFVEVPKDEFDRAMIQQRFDL